MANSFYLSFNSSELGILLSEASSLETQLYLALKKYTDFKTKLISHAAEWRLSLSFFATMLSRPARQGCPELKVHHQGVKRMLEHLTMLGLVADLDMTGTALKMRLPLIGTKVQPTSEKLCRQVAQNPARLCGDSTDGKTLTSRATTGLPADSENRSNGRLCGPEVKNGARLCGKMIDQIEETQTGRAIQGEDVLCTVHSQQQQYTPYAVNPKGGKPPSAPENPNQNQKHLKAETGKPEETAKTATKENRFEAIVAQAGQGRILWLDSKMSRAIYSRWNALDLSESDLRDAIGVLLTEPERHQTANSIDEIIRGRKSIPKARPGKGSVWL